MDKPTDDVLNGKRPAFQFSKQTVKHLRAFLGASAASVTPQLQALVGGHLDAKSSIELRDTRPEIRKMMTALETVIRRIDAASIATQVQLRGSFTLADLLHDSNAWASVVTARQQAVDSLRRLHTAIRTQRGRPRKARREALSMDVGLVLALNGIRISASRAGTLAKVLSAIAFELDDSMPEDLFPLVKKVAHFVRDRNTSPGELRQFIREGYRYSGDKFWAQFLVD